MNASGTVVGDDKSTDPAWTASDVVESYGGNNQLWGSSWTPANINDADFGFVVLATHTSGTASIDFMKVKVTYTTAGSTGSDTYTTPGSSTFTVPTGVTEITVDAWGAGGGGGDGSDRGGGGGGYANSTLSVSPGQEYSVAVGSEIFLLQSGPGDIP